MANRAFLSPIINPVVVGVLRLFFPAILKTLCGGLSISIADEDFEKLRRYQGQRMLFLPNHPNGEEPMVLFEISRRLNEVFNFVAAREVFDWEHGFRGWLLRRTGAYSVIRGAADRESFMMSKKILMEGKNRLVIFIEGEISRGNEALIPFEPGVIQLACWAQEGLVKESAKAYKAKGEAAPIPGDCPPIYVVPLAIRYFYHAGCEEAIERALCELEKTVGICSVEVATAGLNPYQRVRAIGEKMLRVQEELHQITALPGTTLTERANAVKHRMLKKMELFLDLKPMPDEGTLSRLRAIRNALDHLIHTYDDPTELTPYEQRMVEHLRKSLNEFYLDLDRVVYFLTYDEAYLREHPSNESLIETIRRLEREIYGDAKLTYPRVAVVKVGDVINLKEHYLEYEADKKDFVTRTAARFEGDVMGLIASMSRPPHS